MDIIMEKDFQFILTPKRKYLDDDDNMVYVRIRVTDKYLIVIFRTAEMQFTKSFYVKEGDPEKLINDTYKYLKSFCLSKKSGLMHYDDIATDNRLKIMFLDKPGDVSALKGFYNDIRRSLVIDMRFNMNLCEALEREEHDVNCDFKYSSIFD